MILQLTDLQIDYYNFRKDSESFMGWLITLNDNEFKHVITLLNKSEEDQSEEEADEFMAWMALYIYNQIELDEDDIDDPSQDKLWEDSANEILTSLTICTMMRQGLVKTTSRKGPDGDWRYGLTPLGAKVNKKNLENITKKMYKS